VAVVWQQPCFWHVEGEVKLIFHKATASSIPAVAGADMSRAG
jgi:hypothetical protein